jgi:hypothetical protein
MDLLFEMIINRTISALSHPDTSHVFYICGEIYVYLFAGIIYAQVDFVTFLFGWELFFLVESIFRCLF